MPGAPKTSAEPSAARAGVPSCPRGPVLRIAAISLLAAAALAGGLTKVWDSDMPWHLACGERMLRDVRVLGHDPFSIDPEPRWVNVHWLFQVTIAGLNAIGGFELLSVLKAALAVAMVLTFALALRKHLPPAWLLFCGLAMLVVAAGRIRIRPESFTLVFLMLTIVLLEGVRRGGSPARLWWLVPIMLVWVNLHGLFILGLGLTGSAVMGAWIDGRLRRGLSGGLATQQALAPVIAATAACLLTPWPFRTVLHPFLLWTRVSGEAFYYTYGVSELTPTWQVLGAHKEAMVLIVLAAAAMAGNRRRLPVAHVAWLAAFVGIAMLALRNVGLTAPVCGFLLAWHGGEVLRRFAERRPRASKAAPAAMAVAVVLALGLSANWATELTYRLQEAPMRFGAGLAREHYPIDLAGWLADQPVGGDVFCDNFGDSSAFLRAFAAGTDKPRRLLFMDGRLEAHSLDRFIQQNNLRQQLRTVTLAEKIDLPKSVRFVIVGHDAGEKLSVLARCARFRLVRLDSVVACFEDASWLRQVPRGEQAGQILPPANLDDFDFPLGDRRFPSEPRRWYRQNPHATNHAVGLMLLALGQEDDKTRGPLSPLRMRCTVLAARHLAAALEDGVAPRRLVRGALAEAHQQRMVQCGFPLSGPLPADIHSARALYLYRTLDLHDLQDPNMLIFALMNVRVMLQSHQFDAADAAVKAIMDSLPPPQRVNPPLSYLQLRSTVIDELDRVERELAMRLPSPAAGGESPLLREAKDLLASRIGMIHRAIALLRQASQGDAQAALLLGDLLLRTGQPAEARHEYGRVELLLPKQKQPEVALRRILCDWVEGKAAEAQAALASLTAQADSPELSYCQALICHDAGWYGQSEAALARLDRQAATDRSPRTCYLHALALQNLGHLAEAAAAFKGIRADDAELTGLIEYALGRVEDRRRE